MHIFSGEFELKRQLRSLKRRSKRYMNMDLKGRGFDVGDWSHMARDRGHWCANFNKLSGYTEGGEILNQLSDFQIVI